MPFLQKTLYFAPKQIKGSEGKGFEAMMHSNLSFSFTIGFFRPMEGKRPRPKTMLPNEPSYSRKLALAGWSFCLL
jgi:hypothetical protein